MLSEHPAGGGLVSDLELVFQEPHVGDSVVDLRQQSFDILHRDAATATRKKTHFLMQLSFFPFFREFNTSKLFALSSIIPSVCSDIDQFFDGHWLISSRHCQLMMDFCSKKKQKSSITLHDSIASFPVEGTESAGFNPKRPP